MERFQTAILMVSYRTIPGPGIPLPVPGLSV